MIDQERWENVINALELCTSEIETRTQVPCEKCHYHNKEYHGVHGDGYCNMRSLQRDILALLKAQEPRVMTWEDLRNWHKADALKRDPIFVEYIDERIFGHSRWVIDKFGIGALDDGAQCHYNKYIRCWTSRPTDAQREATPWGIT